MFRRNFKVTVLAFLLGVIFATSATAVFAATANGPWGYYGPYQGYYYKNQASISNASGGVVTWAGVENQTIASVPTGYMGAMARLYDSNNVLVSYSTWTYNDSPLYGMYIPSPAYNSSGIYYGKGETAAYNGDGYTVYDTFQSPNINN